MSARHSRYDIRGYDGGFPPRRRPAGRGVLELTEVAWRLIFRGSRAGVSGGLLRSEFDLDAPEGDGAGEAGWRRVTIRGRGQLQFRGSFFVAASDADRLRADVERRTAELARTSDAVAAMARGEWWRDPVVFDGWGWARAVSIAGVRVRAGIPGRRRWWTSVVDFTPEGVSVRGLRSGFTVPWPDVATVAVAGETGRRTPGALTVALRSGERIELATTLHDGDQLAEALAPVTAQLARAAATAGSPAPPADPADPDG